MKTCLIVDDSRIVRRVIRRIIEGIGFTIEEAEDGKQALDAVRSKPFDLILLDWNMPVMDGLEFLKHLRADTRITQPKVIFCTTENEFSKITAAMSAGADEYVMKPFDEPIVLGKLEQLGLA